MLAAVPAVAVVYNEISGTDQDDVLAGTPAPDQIWALAGEDQLGGAGGGDRLRGGADDDKITGATGDDRIAGDAGKDTLRGGSGDDFISSSSDGSRDFVYCGDGANDRVSADARDAVQDDCEKVSVVNKPDSGANSA